MGSDLWSMDVGRRLLVQGVPPAYVRRTVRELRDHVEDMEREADLCPCAGGAVTCERMGDPTKVAHAILHEYRQRVWLARYPWITSVILPVLLSALVLIAYFLLCFGLYLPLVAWITDTDLSCFARGPLQQWHVYTLWSMHLVGCIFPGAFVVGVLGRWGCRLGHRWTWSAASLAIAVLFFATTKLELRCPNAEQWGTYTVDFLQVEAVFDQFYFQALQIAVPTVTGSLVLRHMIRRQQFG